MVIVKSGVVSGKSSVMEKRAITRGGDISEY